MKKLEKSQSNKTCWLYIDTSKPTSLIQLFDLSANLISQKEILENQTLSSELLISIIFLLQNNSLSLHNLEYIKAYPGPGSYTGLRIGMSTANLLALTLNIPIFSSKHSVINMNLFTKTVLPVYAAPPHITQPKSRLK